jgi:mannan endo-1,4-beta-mannosidase
MGAVAEARQSVARRVSGGNLPADDTLKWFCEDVRGDSMHDAFPGWSKLRPLLTICCSLLILSPVLNSQTSFQTLNFLYGIRGLQTVAGEHNREPNSLPSQRTTEIFNTVGLYPALWSGDFLFEASEIANRQTMIDQARIEWSRGTIPHLMWHACSPALSEPCGWDNKGVLSHMSDAQWNDLITDGTAINSIWKQRMDEVAVFLQQLQDHGVEVLFRPLHEMNQGRFWWGGRPGPNGTARLFQMTHDYFKYTKGLHNIIWEWDLQDFDSLAEDISSYNPGKAYFDLFALDIYSGNTQAKYNLALTAASGKPIAIGECSVLPTPSHLSAQPNWAYFMGWAELVFEDNSTAQIQALYHDPQVVTLTHMPGWRSSSFETAPSPKIPNSLLPHATPDRPEIGTTGQER